MKKTRLFFYWLVLAFLVFLYYANIEVLYKDLSPHISDNERSYGAQLIAVIILPVNLVLGFIRLWLLKPVCHRPLLSEISYFAIPVLMMITCFSSLYWESIILSALAEVLIMYEFIRSIVQTFQHR